MPRKTINREALLNKETYTKEDVQDILLVYTNCIRDSYGKAMSIVLLDRDGLKQSQTSIEQHGNDSMHALNTQLDEGNFDDKILVAAEAGKVILRAMQATLRFSKNFLKNDLGLTLPDIRELETYVDMNGNKKLNKSEISAIIREIADEVLNGSTMGSYSGWDYAVDTSRKGAWITVLTHPKHNEIKFVMVDKNEIDPDSDALEYIQRHFGDKDGAENQTIH
jgi:hypothetical protein|nr:MAG TPA: hypothetical protein [Caudoviricetes sp.]